MDITVNWHDEGYSATAEELILLALSFQRESQWLSFRGGLIDVQWLQPTIQVERTVARALFRHDDQ